MILHPFVFFRLLDLRAVFLFSGGKPSQLAQRVGGWVPAALIQPRGHSEEPGQAHMHSSGQVDST